ILEIIVPAPTQIIQVEPTRTQPLLNLAGSSSTTVQDFIGPLQFAAITVIAAVALYVLIAVTWSMIEKATWYCFGKPAKGDSPRKSWSVLSFVLLTVGIISVARYTSSRFGLDLVDLDPLAYVHTAFLAITRTGVFARLRSSLDVGLLFGPLKRGLDTVFPAAARDAQRYPDPITSTRLTPADIEHLFGPLKRAAFPAAASGVQSGTLLYIRNMLLKITSVLSRSLLSVYLGFLFGPLKHGFDTVFSAAAWSVQWSTLTSIHITIASTFRLLVSIKFLEDSFSYCFDTVSAVAVRGRGRFFNLLGPPDDPLTLLKAALVAWALTIAKNVLAHSTLFEGLQNSIFINVFSNDAPASVTTAQSVPSRFPIPALVRRPLELVQAAARFILFIFTAPRICLELEDQLIHTTHQAMMVWHLCQEQERKLDNRRDQLFHARSRCHDLEEQIALLEEEARDGVVSSGAPPPN
ncbi:hypothetical protein DXG01_011738, partial [Tephrocybe rancida]